MKKIKSSLEIALERVGKVQTDRGEIEKLDGEKYLKAASSLASSLLEGKTSKEQIKESLDRYPQEIRGKAFRTLASRLMEGAELSNTMEVMEAIAFLTDHAEIKNICMDTFRSFRQHLDDLKKEKAELQEILGPFWEKELAGEGFRGTALAGFNISGARQWQEAAARFAGDNKAMLAVFREQLAKKLSLIE